MDAVKVITDIVAALPIGSIQRERAELLKTQVETMEARLKLAEDRARHAEERSSCYEAENKELRAEVAQLREQVAASIVSEEFEHRGPFLYRKGTDNPMCPNCKIQLAKRDDYYICTKCRWGHDDTPPMNWGGTRLSR